MNQEANPKHLPASTIDEVIEQLNTIIKESISSNNYLFAFAYVYRETTKQVKTAIDAGRFEDGPRMEKMDVIFANLYIQAYHDYKVSKSISGSWDFAFSARDEKKTLIQHILFGMNAHINLDLSVAASTVSNGAEIMNIKNDFMTINQILAELTNSMQKDLGKVSFMLRLLDIFGFKSDEKIINFSIKKARDFAWLNAMELALCEEGKQQSRIEEIDKRVLELSKIIKDPPGRPLALTMKIISFFESNDPAKIFNKLLKD